MAWTSLPSVSLRFSADDLVIIAVTSTPGATSIVTSVFTEPTTMFFTVPLRALRISRVYSGALEESVQKFLEMLGKLNRAYLTDLEEKVLSILESEIKV